MRRDWRDRYTYEHLMAQSYLTILLGEIKEEKAIVAVAGLLASDAITFERIAAHVVDPFITNAEVITAIVRVWYRIQRSHMKLIMESTSDRHR